MSEENYGLQLIHSLLLDPEFNFNYFNRHKTNSKGKPWKMMPMQHDYQMGWLLNDTILIRSGRSCGKCQDYNSLVRLQDGTYSKVSELINTWQTLESFNQDTNELEWAEAYFTDNGEQECYELVLENGLRTTVTSEHMFLKNNIWTQIVDLNDGESIMTPDELTKEMKNIKIKEINYRGRRPTVAIDVNNSTHIVDGILSHNTSSVSATVFRHVITHPDKKTAYIVKNEKHMNSFVKEIEDYFLRDDFTRIFYHGYTKKERIFRFTNGHTIEIRIAGQDKTGSTSFIALHVDYMIIDEAQLLEYQMLSELMPGKQEGSKMMVAGVPNNFRNTVLYYYATKEHVTQYHYMSEESADWDANKERDALDICGGSKESTKYKNLYMGLFCDASTAVFLPSKIVSNIADDIDFSYVSFVGDSFEKLLTTIEMPALRTKYTDYIIGADMGYTTRSPMHISVLGRYKSKVKIDGEKIEKDFYDCIMRLNISISAAPESAKLFNFLMTYFNCRLAAIDGQNYGSAIYTNLISKDLFPDTYKLNETYIQSLIFGDPIITGTRKVTDPNSGIEKIEEIKTTLKIMATDHLAGLIDEGRFKIAEADSGTCEHTDLVTILQSEAQTHTQNKLHSRQFHNIVNEHATDSLRCCSYIIKIMIEDGFRINNVQSTMVAPMRLSKSIYTNKQRRT